MTDVLMLVIEGIIIAAFFAAIGLFRTPSRAKYGNMLAGAGMFCAVAMVLLEGKLNAAALVIVALALGSVAGWWVSLRVNMLQIPAMIGFQNGAGGFAAFLVSFVELTRGQSSIGEIGLISGILGIVVGAATFSGSMVASAKLAGLVRQKPIHLARHNLILAAIAAVLVACGAAAASLAGAALLYAASGLILFGLVLGVIFVIRIGGADMPVLISFLNAGSGMAAALCGMVIESRLLIACGAVVAASGTILTHMMCRAMNRDILNVLVAGDMKPSNADEAKTEPATGLPETAAADDSAQRPPLERALAALGESQSVVVIPGYGMALAHAQFEVVKIANLLEKQGKRVRFAIHPIAGRMPGHMHVLLAEAEVDPDMLFDLPEINDQFKETDFVLITGACDVVNPAAITVAGTPISGMPILAAHEAKRVLVCNLDDRPGYSGVDNPLYKNPKTIMMLGDAKASLTELLQSLG